MYTCKYSIHIYIYIYTYMLWPVRCSAPRSYRTSLQSDPKRDDGPNASSQ